MPLTLRFLLALCLSLPLLSISVLTASAQQNDLDDWPCVQRYVPEILPASYWPIPIADDLVGTWRRDADTAMLARQLGALEAVDEESLEAMAAFADGVPESDREVELSRLADGIVDVADERRARYLDGIRRYTRQQIAIAGQIESTLNQLADLDDAERQAEGADAAGDETDAGTTAVNPTDRAEIEQTLAWHERLYDQRERAIRSLCERPVELEQVVSAVLRDLSYHLP